MIGRQNQSKIKSVTVRVAFGSFESTTILLPTDADKIFNADDEFNWLYRSSILPYIKPWLKWSKAQMYMRMRQGNVWEILPL